MKPINIYSKILEKYRCHYNYDHNNPHTIKSYIENKKDQPIYDAIESVNNSINPET